MSDNYQAVYDAVRSKLSNCNVGDVVRDVLWQHFDISHMKVCVGQDLYAAVAEYRRPSAVYRPALSLDGNQWCALYGQNLQDGLAGFGDTPEKAMIAFDIAWLNEKARGAK
jgi:hypothetical protein